MGTVIALKNLLHFKVRTLVAVSGVCFAVTLLFIQLGFFESLLVTATRVFDALDCDLLLTSSRYVALTQTGTLPRTRLPLMLEHPEVATVMPAQVGRQMWRNPAARSRHAMLILGFNPEDPVVKLPELAAELPALNRRDTILVDRLSRPEVGAGQAGVVTELGPRSVETVGTFALGPGFDNGVLVVSEVTFDRLFPNRPRSEVSLGLVKLRPGADANRVAEQIRQGLPPDVRVLTRAEANGQEQYFWVVRTSIGIIFGSGVVVAVLFGLVIIYQVLSLEVSHRLSEYATLKALGFSNGFVAGIVLRQALVFAVVSFAVAFALAWAVYTLSSGVTNLPVVMTVGRAVGVFLVTVVMCSVSGLLALRTLRRADPVELFGP